jgi:hypothetical protein
LAVATKCFDRLEMPRQGRGRGLADMADAQAVDEAVQADVDGLNLDPSQQVTVTLKSRRKRSSRA